MELWIRSQDKEDLQKVEHLGVYDKKIYINGYEEHGYCIAEYKTKERALEVLDEIQNKLNESNNSYEDLLNKLKIFSETPIIKCDNNDNCNISLNIAMLKDMIIYEIPKE